MAKASRHSGVNGSVNINGNQIGLLKWDLELTADNGQYVANDTAGWKATVEGPHSAKGNFTIAAEGNCSFSEGDLITAMDLMSGGGMAYTGDGRIDSVKTQVDLSTGDPVAFDVAFSGDGAWATGSGS
jgi:hypothetical protein